MEKIKNLLNPGAKQDEEVMYGSGKSSDPVHSGTTGGTSGQGSHLGSSQARHNPLSSANNPTPSNVSSGHSGNPTAGGQQSSLTGIATSRSGPSTAFDDGASTASIKSGIQGHSQSGAGLIGSPGSNDPVDTNKPLPSTPASGLTGGNTAGGPHASALANRADPRVDSDLDGSSGLGRGTTGAGLTGSGLPDRRIGSPGSGSSYLGRDPAAGVGALGGASLAEHERSPGTGRDSEGLGGGVGSAVRGYGPADWEHEHQRHGHRYEGDPCAHGDVDPVGPHLTSGPHATDTANRLDPHVAGNTGPLETTAGEALGHQHGHPGASASGTGVPSNRTGTGIGGSGTGYDGQSQNRHLGREGALAGGIGATAVGAYEAEKHHHGQVDPATTSATPTTGAPATGYTEPYSSSGVDPRLDPTSHSGITGTGTDRHLGRDAGITGAGGLAAYEAEKHHHARDEPGRTSGLSGTTAGTTGRDYDNTQGAFVPRTDNLASAGHHSGRDAGVAGAGTFGGAEYSKHHAEKHRHEGDRHEGDTHEGKKHGGVLGFLHHDKDSTSDRSKSHGGHDDDSRHDSHQDAKPAAGAVGGAEYSKHHHAEKHRHEGDSHEGKKHGGILGFLHPDKDSTSDRSKSHGGHDHDSRHDSHQGAKTAAGAGAVGAGTAAYEHGKHGHERNRLHKDPPEGYASQVTGGTGTTALAEGDSVQRGSHMSGLGNKLDPNVSGRGESLPEGEVIEPHTGLPINISKYGTGAGGTDDTPVPGYHQHNN